eukprot:CAMPEP_0178945756 /NCGR_PEP_ID=MMETSP0789-20121207/3908_1 /TAXON_ID=3005 /ORGANISM="Rhizosolenia setigera, Strain CCMP 1694" /LENGTH=2019 /DNA_ID=CAMNT_0020625675 /DNA_START=629 /DNA_END=6688 /DNA_ORIENTATION=+
MALIGGTFFVTSELYFAVCGSCLMVLCAILSVKFARSAFVTLSAVLIGGAVSVSIVHPAFCSHILNVTLGYDHILRNKIPLSSEKTYTLYWIIASFLTLAATIQRAGGTAKFLTSLTPTAQTRTVTTPPKRQIINQRKPVPASSPDVYNMFDPSDLPLRLAEYANMVYSACEDLGNFFGFQDASVRNQAEHLLILLSNNRRYMTMSPSALAPPSPIHALHSKVFSNYHKWCKKMCVLPNHSRMQDSSHVPYGAPAIVSRVVDLVLFFCVWGEAANVRHMPECLWFLYHKMMEEYTRSGAHLHTRSLYAGHFVDNVVEPIYEIVCKSMKSSKDHPEKRNYDDFNEFFWSNECLRYGYCSRTTEDDVESPAQNSLGVELPPISEGLTMAPKTFLEKRSWLRGILAMYRILEWHIVTFYLLSVIAFSRELVWGWVYSCQVASGVFWILNSLYITWGLIEVWSNYPNIQLGATAICGSVFTLVTRFLILVYQTLYLIWTFGPTKSTHFGIAETPTYWWWQYIWLSALCMAPYILEGLMLFYPASTTMLFTSQNDFVQSFLNILSPLSRIYVGKEVHESFKRTSVYLFFWFTLMAWKLLFSYMFEVSSMVLPTIELTDDFINYPNQSFYKMSMILVLRWTPQFIVYLIDMSIWYAVWQAFAGTAVGFSEHLGDVRSMDDIRDNFVRAPEHFCKKMLSSDAGSRRGSSSSFSFLSSSNISNPNLGEGQSLLGSDPHQLQSYVNRLLDVRIQKWVMFSAAWNEIIDHFRDEDIISNEERDNLKFSRFEGFSQAIYLPVFQTAGVFENAIAELEVVQQNLENQPVSDELFFKAISGQVITSTAVSEVWELGSYILLQMLGKVHNDDIVAIMNLMLKWSENGTLTDHLKVEKLRSFVNQFIKLVGIMKKGISRRTPSAKPRSRPSDRGVTMGAKAPAAPSTSFRRAVSIGSLTSMDTGDSADKNMTLHDMTIKPRKKTTTQAEGLVILDALRDQTRDVVRGILSSLKGLIKNVDTESSEVLDRLTFVMNMESGYLWNDSYASDQLDVCAKDQMFTKVLSKVHGLVNCHPDDVEPKSQEVKRRLTFFVNSLFMDIPDAPPIQDMMSWNVMTPFYSEDVTYNKRDLETRTDALGVSTMLYLQTLHRADWNNFLERNGIDDEEKIWSKKYINETRRWASLRAQTLMRTVSGMMYYEKALRLLANLERVDDDSADNYISEKFGYIVACQVYGNMKKNQDPKADDIEQLMHRFPHMRVAYIDTVRLNRGGASEFYSVLVKSDKQGGIQEVYRVRLPGNPVLGEGKPENQNHAMIFSRGEYVQTIDMNQEGYFEEALKMRNGLQEFLKREGPLPTTILGLREHIFTGSVSSLANYMALQETSFVTLGQRVLTNPLCIRLHYGHPDVFDKLFFMTRGGISKSSKGINLSEDIFAGYNNVVRGGQVSFKEYLQVGKGRDVGMSQIYKFEAKLSQGAAEQSLSRDIYRVSHRLDFCRLLSMYYGGIGHYFSNVLTVFTIYVVVYLMLILALFNLEKIGDRVITPMGTIQMLLGGLGLLQTIPLFATLGVERGWWASLREIIAVFASGGPFHFMFHIQTKANYMAQTILVGGAKYRATGRGFVTQHTPMDEQFRFFASSHLYLGVEVGASLVLMGIYSKAGQYAGRTWSLWLASLSFLASPFWFNPLTFDMNYVVSDYDTYLRWMKGTSGGAAKSWWMWWREEHMHYKKLVFSSKMLYVFKSALYVLIGEGIRRSSLFEADMTLTRPFIAINKILIVLPCMIFAAVLFSSNERSFSYPVRRTIGILFALGISMTAILLFIEDSNYLRYLLAAYYEVGALCQLGLLGGVGFVQYLYFLHDLVVGHIIFIPLFVLGALQIPHHIQTWLLYHNALSSDVVVSNILRYARKTQEKQNNAQDTDLVEQIAELRKIVQRQEQMLSSGAYQVSGEAYSKANASTDAITALARSPDTIQEIPPHQPASTTKRVMSMSGLDVWGDMALGDQNQPSYQQEASSQNRTPQQGQASHGFSFTQPDKLPPR